MLLDVIVQYVAEITEAKQGGNSTLSVVSRKLRLPLKTVYLIMLAIRMYRNCVEINASVES